MVEVVISSASLRRSTVMGKSSPITTKTVNSQNSSAPSVICSMSMGGRVRASPIRAASPPTQTTAT